MDILKTKKVLSSVNIDKTKLELKRKRNILNCLYRQLGKLTFLYIHKNSFVHTYKKTTQQICDKINNERELIKKLEKRISSINNDIIEDNRIDKANLNVPKPILSPEGYRIYKFCEKCQIGNNPDAKECIYCGERFNN